MTKSHEILVLAERLLATSIDEVIKIVIRGNKKVKKLDCPGGYKSFRGRCVHMSADETRARSRASRKSAISMRGSLGAIRTKHRRSMAFRHTVGMR